MMLRHASSLLVLSALLGAVACTKDGNDKAAPKASASAAVALSASPAPVASAAPASSNAPGKAKKPNTDKKPLTDAERFVPLVRGHIAHVGQRTTQHTG